MIQLHGVAKAWYNYFKPQTRITHVSGNAKRLDSYAAWCERLLYGRLPWTFDYAGQEKPFYLFTSLGIPLLLIYGLHLIRRRGGRNALDPAARAVLAFALLTAAYVAVVGNSLEVWENQRFRFYTDPLLAVMLALAVENLGARLRQGRAGGQPSEIKR